MSLKRNCVWLAVLALGFLATTPSNAWAYVDPGTGSYLFQLAAAGFFAGMFTIRQYWGAVKARLRRQPTSPEPGSSSTDQTE